MLFDTKGANQSSSSFEERLDDKVGFGEESAELFKKYTYFDFDSDDESSEPVKFQAEAPAAPSAIAFNPFGPSQYTYDPPLPSFTPSSVESSDFPSTPSVSSSILSAATSALEAIESLESLQCDPQEIEDLTEPDTKIHEVSVRVHTCIH